MNLPLAKADRKKIIQDINRLQRMMEPNIRSVAGVVGQHLSERLGQMWKMLAVHPQDSLKQLEDLKTRLMLLNGYLELLPRIGPQVVLQDKVRMCREIETLSKYIQNDRAV